MVTTYLRGRQWEDDWGKEPEAAPEPEPEPDWGCRGCDRTYPAGFAATCAECPGCSGKLRPPESGVVA